MRQNYKGHLLRNIQQNTDTDDDLSKSDTDDDAIEGNNEVTDTNAEQYYTSGVWEQKVDNILTGIGGIDQPKHAKMHKPLMLTTDLSPQQ